MQIGTTAGVGDQHADADGIAICVSRILTTEALHQGRVFHPGARSFIPPICAPDGIKPYPPVGHEHVDGRFDFFYLATGITPAMCRRLTGIGLQYLLNALDANKEYFDGAKDYKCTLPAGIPQANFWSMTVHDNQTRSMLQTPQRFPRAGSQPYPTSAAVPNADGSVDVYSGPEPPEGLESNWIQTVPGKGWFTILRLCAPLQPFFDKTWQPSEITAIS